MLCRVCRGIWLDRGELDKIIERSAAYEAGANSASGYAVPAPGYAQPAPWDGCDEGHHGDRHHSGGHHGGGHGGYRPGGFLGRLFA